MQGFREDGGLYLESDTDEQLLIHIPFSSAVKINSVIIQSKSKPEQVGGGAATMAVGSLAGQSVGMHLARPLHLECGWHHLIVIPGDSQEHCIHHPIPVHVQLSIPGTTLCQALCQPADDRIL